MNLSGALSSLRKKVHSTSRHHAILLFGEASRRLLDISNWHVISGDGSAIFSLCDHNGDQLNKPAAQEGDLVRVEAPGTKSGPLWMRVQKIVRERQLIKDEETLALHLQSLHSPGGSNIIPADDHPGYLLELKLIRNADKVQFHKTASESAHKISAGYLFDRLRDSLVSFASMLNGSSQWKNLADGILDAGRLV
jgi:hypothetical protein